MFFVGFSLFQNDHSDVILRVFRFVIPKNESGADNSEISKIRVENHACFTNRLSRIYKLTDALLGSFYSEHCHFGGVLFREETTRPDGSEGKGIPATVQIEKNAATVFDFGASKSENKFFLPRKVERLYGVW